MKYPLFDTACSHPLLPGNQEGQSSAGAKISNRRTGQQEGILEIQKYNKEVETASMNRTGRQPSHK